MRGRGERERSCIFPREQAPALRTNFPCVFRFLVPSRVGAPDRSGVLGYRSPITDHRSTERSRRTGSRGAGRCFGERVCLLGRQTQIADIISAARVSALPKLSAAARRVSLLHEPIERFGAPTRSVAAAAGRGAGEGGIGRGEKAAAVQRERLENAERIPERFPSFPARSGDSTMTRGDVKSRKRRAVIDSATFPSRLLNRGERVSI